VNLREGTRRLALLMGVAGAIVGGFASYLELQTTLDQKRFHDRFEELAASGVVQQEERNCLNSPAGSERLDVKMPPNGSGIKTISLRDDCKVGTIETGSEFLFEDLTPNLVSTCLLASTFPILGFLVPWGLVRVIGWVGAGFVQSSR